VGVASRAESSEITTASAVAGAKLMIGFSNVTAEGGELVVAWDNQVGALPFKVAK
jgi:hypothetical protein